MIKRKVSKNHTSQALRKIQLDEGVNQDEITSQNISYTTYNAAKDADNDISNAISMLESTAPSLHDDPYYNRRNQPEAETHKVARTNSYLLET